ncbi:hypothetical protein MAPG_00572 [Magnaporthiopsis poae ATCC 64411]|uniref:Secreted protein n=1 Tax=Magnaporthiopsis poae (strain ATCC 64411 / 73-15) TaxID=644358 RepID=A0A0C4DLD0_MAGP6|nr:hypothetical protein MAPG_00572 [Magnaporthiopsis poae ATCC 64411]
MINMAFLLLSCRVSRCCLSFGRRLRLSSRILGDGRVVVCNQPYAQTFRPAYAVPAASCDCGMHEPVQGGG